MGWNDVGKYNKPVVERVWRRVLKEWLQWDADRIDSWLLAWEPELRDEGNAFFYHDPITSDIVQLFLEDAVADRLRRQRTSHAPDDLMALTWRLEQVFEPGAQDGSVWEETFDWELARRQVDTLLNEVGAAIPAPASVSEYERRCREQL